MKRLLLTITFTVLLASLAEAQQLSAITFEASLLACRAQRRKDRRRREPRSGIRHGVQDSRHSGPGQGRGTAANLSPCPRSGSPG